jgi:phosphate transport system protein
MQRDLERLTRLVLRMAGYVEEAVYQAVHALRENDRGQADRVIEGDGRIDELENEVLEECLKILALHQPVAVDLRRTCAVLLISTDLERMGDLAGAIAGRAIAIANTPRPPVPARLNAMTDMATDMVRRALDAFVNSDAPGARAVIRTDARIDEANDAIIAELIEQMKRSPEHVEAALSLFSATRHLERIADHATNIAEDVIYLVEGEVVRHHHETLGDG